MEGLEIRPVTAERWADVARFFERHGNPNYCWCMTWRMSSSEYRDVGRAGRRSALRKRVMSGDSVGLLAYRGGEPIAWCSVAPRSQYARLERARSIRAPDDRAPWSIVCLFIDPDFRGQDLASQLLEAAVAYARESGAELVEGYPVEPEFDEQGRRLHARSYRFMGYRSSYEKAGFVDVTPPDSPRPILRYDLREPGRAGGEAPA